MSTSSTPVSVLPWTGSSVPKILVSTQVRVSRRDKTTESVPPVSLYPWLRVVLVRRETPQTKPVYWSRDHTRPTTTVYLELPPTCPYVPVLTVRFLVRSDKRPVRQRHSSKFSCQHHPVPPGIVPTSCPSVLHPRQWSDPAVRSALGGSPKSLPSPSTALDLPLSQLPVLRERRLANINFRLYGNED